MSYQKLLLADYKKPEFSILSTELYFDIQDQFVIVKSHTKYENLCQAKQIQLNGEGLELIEILLNNKKLEEKYYTIEHDLLKIELATYAEHNQLTNLTFFDLKIQNKINPYQNTSYDGLYYTKSGVLCTQCEPQAFRKICYFLDRPDCMTTYTVHIEADKNRFPVLLSNGNRIESKELANNRQCVSYQDPFKKPSYLFALVAGDLACLKDEYTTSISSKKVQLEIYASKENIERCHHAMKSLKESMRWDEDKNLREYDLSTYMIVSVDDFNSGAMENKGLNIFNSKYVLASPDSATDQDFYLIQSVIAHEYFHNWTGNRITVRDWFQLSVKEGLTIFRDQEFSSDYNSRTLKRIDDVERITSLQFAEDAGPTAHPVRPTEALNMDNLFTLSIYEKGAELIRMMKWILGDQKFHTAMQNYFHKFDAKAITVDDFIDNMQDSSGIDLSEFRKWYYLAGTPKVIISEQNLHKDNKLSSIKIKLEQNRPDTSLLIPILIGVLGQEEEINAKDLQIEGLGSAKFEIRKEGILLFLSNKIAEFSISSNKAIRCISYLRDFSAPIYLDKEESIEDLIHIMNFESNYFAKYKASQKIFKNEFLLAYEAQKNSQSYIINTKFLSALKSICQNYKNEIGGTAKLLQFPSVDSFFTEMKKIEFEAASLAYKNLIAQIVENLETEFFELYSKLAQDKEAKANTRDLKNTCLNYLSKLKKYNSLAHEQFSKASNMTDSYAALKALQNSGSNAIQDTTTNAMIESFYQKWEKDDLVINKYFSLQAVCQDSNLLQHWDDKISNKAAYDLHNPNKVYNSIYAFAALNPMVFHTDYKNSYPWYAQWILKMDQQNPSVASRLASTFKYWNKMDQKRKDLWQSQLEFLAKEKLSSKTYEMIEKSLKSKTS